MSFDDTILLKLKRDFSENEAVAFLAGKLSECLIEIGKLKSELAEKDYILKQSEKSLQIVNNLEVGISRYKRIAEVYENLYRKLLEENKK